MADRIRPAVCLSACKGSYFEADAYQELFTASYGGKLSGLSDAVLLYYLFIFHSRRFLPVAAGAGQAYMELHKIRTGMRIVTGGSSCVLSGMCFSYLSGVSRYGSGIGICQCAEYGRAHQLF